MTWWQNQYSYHESNIPNRLVDQWNWSSDGIPTPAEAVLTAQNSPVSQPSVHFTKARPICSAGLIWMLWIFGWAGVMSYSITWSSRIEFGMLKRSHVWPVFHLPLWPSAGQFYTSHCSHQLEVTCPHSMYMYWPYFLVWMLNKIICSEVIHHLLNLLCHSNLYHFLLLCKMFEIYFSPYNTSGWWFVLPSKSEVK